VPPPFFHDLSDDLLDCFPSFVKLPGDAFSLRDVMASLLAFFLGTLDGPDGRSVSPPEMQLARSAILPRSNNEIRSSTSDKTDEHGLLDSIYTTKVEIPFTLQQGPDYH
jgi:hypothetical protein